MSKNLFITGTGTDVGKTYVTGLIVKKLRETGYRPAYYKAGMSGNLRREDGSLIPGDADFVRTLAVFLMLFIFIALICFAAVVVVLSAALYGVYRFTRRRVCRSLCIG